MPTTPKYGPLIPIKFNTPPNNRKRPGAVVLFDGYSPVHDALYQVAKRATMDYDNVTESTELDNLFPETHLSSFELDIECRTQIEHLLEANKQVFLPNGKPASIIEHSINTGNSIPISVRPYRLSPPKTEILKKEVDKMLEENVIEPCMSPWSAPVVMVPKKDGGTRVCIDYRQLNKITTPDVYPLPRIDDLLHAKRTPFMTTIDLRAGYWQIKVNEADQIKTAFITPFGMYKFLRIPFGLRNAPATFQRMMDRFRNSLVHVKILVYLDDLIILSQTFEQHLTDLQEVLDRLHEYNLTVNKEKCNWCCSKVSYLGHYITAQGLEMDPEKTSCIRNMTTPSNLKHLISFLQMCSWYRRFVPNFAKIAEPLSRLTKKNAV